MSCANTPRVTHCFRRPLRGGGAGVCAAAAVNATVGRKSRRRIGSLPDQEVSLFRGAACQAAEPRVVSAFLSFLRIAPERAYRSEEHTSELQSLRHLVCRLLLEKKK